MADPEHVSLVRRGGTATWEWRGGRLDLRDAELSGVSLRGARLDQADLRGARLVGADLTGSRLQEANLTGAQLIRATLDDVRCGGSGLRAALLCSASLRRAVLVRADLGDANLAGADLEAANLSQARLAGAVLDRTKLVDADLAGVTGLDTVQHQGPSELGTHALLRYGHEMPAEFLRGVGLPDGFIRYLPAIIASARPVDFWAITICAAPADSELGRRLHNDLQSAGIRCWFRTPQAHVPELDEAVRVHDRAVVIWSRSGAGDSRVIAELRASRRRGAGIVVRLDDAPLDPAGEAGGELAVFDFTRWHDFRAYAGAFEELRRYLIAAE